MDRLKRLYLIKERQVVEMIILMIEQILPKNVYMIETVNIHIIFGMITNCQGKRQRNQAISMSMPCKVISFGAVANNLIRGFHHSMRNSLSLWYLEQIEKRNDGRVGYSYNIHEITQQKAISLDSYISLILESICRKLIRLSLQKTPQSLLKSFKIAQHRIEFVLISKPFQYQYVFKDFLYFLVIPESFKSKATKFERNLKIKSRQMKQQRQQNFKTRRIKDDEDQPQSLYICFSQRYLSE